MRILFFTIFFLYSYSAIAQEKDKYETKVSIDGTYLLSFFKTEEPRITPFNIKFFMNNKYNIRAGFNLNSSTSTNRGFEGDIKIGFDIPKKYAKTWSYYYGVDINGAYYNYNDRDNTTTILSVIPFFGFEVFLTKEFSLSYEPKLIYNYYKYKNPSSIINQVNYNEELKLTGLSQFFINFNF
tara:strand:- start:38469 stop:39014 length:546 start_codon:yes stop_codon:yes gene_type:complete